LHFAIDNLFFVFLLVLLFLTSTLSINIPLNMTPVILFLQNVTENKTN